MSQTFRGTLEAYGVPQRCDWCHTTDKKMTMWRHATGRILNLCFHGCQFMPEPYKATGLSDEWARVDPYSKHRPQPRIRHSVAGGHDWREQ
jgi:hypothetical protein